MDQAEPLKPAALPVTEAFAFADVPRLTAALKRGDEAAFAWLHGEWSLRINRYCFALNHLTPDERALIEGRYFTGKSLEAIGARHALSARAVEGRLARLRARLRELIAEELLSSSP
ncbi:MAG: sigma factor-like helix-turn-helix DNA-binding protein [Verrucomicrobiales bacterium]